LIRKIIEKNPNTIGILLTSSEVSAREAMDSGVVGYLMKPVDTENLVLELSRALQRHSFRLCMRHAARIIQETTNEFREQFNSRNTKATI